jgi:hypothetical protein
LSAISVKPIAAVKLRGSKWARMHSLAGRVWPCLPKSPLAFVARQDKTACRHRANAGIPSDAKSSTEIVMYDAFISYSHAKDRPIAAALQSVLQTLGKSWWQRRKLRVFRDETSLSATPALWPSIEAALTSSRYLVLLASPESAASDWVNKEIQTWFEYRGLREASTT